VLAEMNYDGVVAACFRETSSIERFIRIPVEGTPSAFSLANSLSSTNRQ
jgi:hypothetical protein